MRRYHAERARAAQLALLPPSVPMSHDEIIAKFEASMDKVCLTHAARDAEMAKLVSVEALEPALEPTLCAADPGASRESQNPHDPRDLGVLKEPQNGDHACKRPPSTHELRFRQPAHLRRSRVHKSVLRANQKQGHPAFAIARRSGREPCCLTERCSRMVMALPHPNVPDADQSTWSTFWLTGGAEQ